jgi:hypothetical protein
MWQKIKKALIWTAAAAGYVAAIAQWIVDHMPVN